MKQMYTLLILLLLASLGARAQESETDSLLDARISALESSQAYTQPREEHFMVVGLATFGFVYNQSRSTFGGVSSLSKTNSLADADHYEFSPMLLWRHSDRWLMEFEPSFDGTSIGVNWAAVSYYATPGLILRAGYLEIPFGIYNKRLAAGWIDKLPTDPNGLADVPPTSDFGVEAEGGFPLGSMKGSYDVAITNGYQLITDAENAGQLQSPGVVDNNLNKTLVGRFSILPFSNSSLELGFSGLYGKVGDPGTDYSQAKTFMYALDLDYVHTFQPFLVHVLGQYNYIHVDHETYTDTTAQAQSYAFTNTTRTGFAQISVRPSGLNTPVVKNLELAYRYGTFDTPTGSYWGGHQESQEVGLDYWVNWRTVLKVGYSAISGPVYALKTRGAFNTSHSMYLQFSVQL